MQPWSWWPVSLDTWTTCESQAGGVGHLVQVWQGGQHPGAGEQVTGHQVETWSGH